jgi:hypothetical protein
MLKDSKPPSRSWSKTRSCLLATSKHTLFLKFLSLARDKRSRIDPESAQPLRRNLANDFVNLLSNASNAGVLAQWQHEIYLIHRYTLFSFLRSPSNLNTKSFAIIQYAS